MHDYVVSCFIIICMVSGYGAEVNSQGQNIGIMSEREDHDENVHAELCRKFQKCTITTNILLLEILGTIMNV